MSCGVQAKSLHNSSKLETSLAHNVAEVGHICPTLDGFGGAGAKAGPSSRSVRKNDRCISGLRASGGSRLATESAAERIWRSTLVIGFGGRLRWLTLAVGALPTAKETICVRPTAATVAGGGGRRMLQERVGDAQHEQGNGVLDAVQRGECADLRGGMHGQASASARCQRGMSCSRACPLFRRCNFE